MARNEYKYEYGVLVSSLPPGRVKVKKLGKSEFREEKSMDNKSLVRRFDA